MHHDYWHDRWRTREIGFHRASAHPLLERWWPTLEIPADARVYVPLCGKSLDVAWLAEQGHTVVGSELSPVAIREFFEERGLTPSRERDGAHVRHTAGPYTIFEGDALALTPAQLGPIDAAYDRAALVALPPEMRIRYAISIAALLESGARMLVVTFEYPQERIAGPPFAVMPLEAHRLFDSAFSVREIDRLDIVEERPKFVDVGIRLVHEVAYRLERLP